MIQKIVAPNGYVYTNGETSGGLVYLGKNDSADNWRLVEITETVLSETEQKALAYDILMGVSE